MFGDRLSFRLSALCSLTLGVATAAALTLAGPAEAKAIPFTPDEGDAVCRGADGYSKDFGGRRTFMWRPAWLERIAADSKRSREIIKAAEAALGRSPYSVTDKPRILPGASANDYASIGPYWWPDPKRDDGLPYYRRDGEVNPERNGPAFDKGRLSALGADVEALAVAYYLTSEERFAEQGAKLLRAWFLDPETRMNPNMNFAQGIPGKVDGRGEGLIEASDFSTIIESIGLLGPSPALTKADHAGLRQWYANFAQWMATSDNGLAQMRKGNNHGIFFDFYLSHFAIFAGMDTVTRNIVDRFPTERLARQMDAKGRFPHELKRTRSWHYSNYLVGGAARLATIGECTGQDLWNTTLEDGRGLRTAHEYLGSFVKDMRAWPFPDRDQEAGNFDKMRRTFVRVDTMFAGPDAVTAFTELP